MTRAIPQADRVTVDWLSDDDVILSLSDGDTVLAELLLDPQDLHDLAVHLFGISEKIEAERKEKAGPADLTIAGNA